MRNMAIGAGLGAAVMSAVMGVVVPQIQDFEGTKLQTYHDVRGILTVCSGHTGPDVVVGKVYTKEQCSALTQEDAKKAASGVLAVSPQLLYHPMQLAAAISFSYNVGTGTYGKSSVASNFNNGNFIEGCNSLLKYTNAGGKFVQGLYNRRVVEHTICLSTLTPKGLKSVGA
jgi:lysozyme